MSKTSLGPMRKIDAAGACAALLLTASAYLFGLEPLLAREAELRDRQAELTSKEEEAAAAERAFVEMRKQIVIAEQAVAENPLRLHPLYRLNTRLGELAVAASRHGLQVDQIEPGRAIPSTHYVTVPIRITGRSTYGGATRFLHEIRASMSDIAVATVELTGEPRNRLGGAKFTIALLWHASPAASDGGTR